MQHFWPDDLCLSGPLLISFFSHPLLISSPSLIRVSFIYWKAKREKEFTNETDEEWGDECFIFPSKLIHDTMIYRILSRLKTSHILHWHSVNYKDLPPSTPPNETCSFFFRRTSTSFPSTLYSFTLTTHSSFTLWIFILFVNHYSLLTFSLPYLFNLSSLPISRAEHSTKCMRANSSMSWKRKEKCTSNHRLTPSPMKTHKYYPHLKVESLKIHWQVIVK